MTRTPAPLRRFAAALSLLFVLLAGCGDDDSVDGKIAPALALSPPMGWNSWNRFHCDIDENLIRETADALVSSGMRDAGYVYLNIDDCWQADERDAGGNLSANPDRFPHGIKPLADYAHRGGLKLGIYASPGTRTCAKFPGSLGHEEQDARNFAAWGVDYLKYDWCGANDDGQEEIPAYTKMSAALNATGRPIVYAICEYGAKRPWLWGKSAGGHLWRTLFDIFDDYFSITLIMSRQANVAKYATQQGWNDPDMLEIGNGGMTDAEYRSHFSLWSIMNAPLLAGNDVRSMTPATKEILLNREVIAVDQDWGGAPGVPVKTIGGVQVWAKPMSDGSVAAVAWNNSSTTANVSIAFADLGLPPSPSYRVRDLWAHTEAQIGDSLRATIAAHASAMFRIWAQAG